MEEFPAGLCLQTLHKWLESKIALSFTFWSDGGFREISEVDWGEARRFQMLQFPPIDEHKFQSDNDGVKLVEFVFFFVCLWWIWNQQMF